jgi:hypothetical protein
MNKKRSQLEKAMIESANEFFKNSPDNKRAERKFLHDYVSALLLKAGTYNGFNFVYWLDQGYQEWILAGQPDNYKGQKDKYIYGPSNDDSRIRYY